MGTRVAILDRIYEITTRSILVNVIISLNSSKDSPFLFSFFSLALLSLLHSLAFNCQTASKGVSNVVVLFRLFYLALLHSLPLYTPFLAQQAKTFRESKQRKNSIRRDREKQQCSKLYLRSLGFYCETASKRVSDVVVGIESTSLESTGGGNGAV